MDARNSLIMNGKYYKILHCEYEDIVLPEDYNISPIWKNDINFRHYATYELLDFQLYLHEFTVTSDREYPMINGVTPDVFYSEKIISTAEYQNLALGLDFSGAIIIAADLVKDYGHETLKCFNYKQVKELIFFNGKLVTTINHNKAMHRIRKNLDTGLRVLEKKRDEKCIRKFIKASFVGNYEKPLKNNKTKKVEKYMIKKFLNRWDELKRFELIKKED